MALFAVYVSGSNRSRAWARAGLFAFEVKPNGTGEAVVLFRRAGDQELRPALFTSREDARRVALACHWAGQSFETRPARGSVRERGVLVELAARSAVVSCQEKNR